MKKRRFQAEVGKKNQQIICFCNNISKEVIEKAILEGAQTLNEIYDATTAGVGPCGGSCRRKIAPHLEAFLETGKFEDVIKTPSRCDKK